MARPSWADTRLMDSDPLLLCGGGRVEGLSAGGGAECGGRG